MSEILFLRVIETDITWELHAYLRFRGYFYVTENTNFRVALGFPTPLLITDSSILSGRSILDSMNQSSLPKKSGYELSMIADLAQATRALATKKLQHSSNAFDFGTRWMFQKFASIHHYFSQAEYDIFIWCLFVF